MRDPVPLVWSDAKEHLRKAATAINLLLDGKGNNTGSVTLTASSATTTLSDRRIGRDSVLTFMATTANAQAEVPYVTSVQQGQCTLNHASNSQADRTFKYTVTG